jgi:aminoglycoside phosphotransferase (APT) family kinase protein
MTDLDVSALARYLGTALPSPPAGPVQAELISGGKSNLTYRVTDSRDRWILRRPPLGPVFGGAHDVGREYRVMSGLRDTDVPVPRTLVNCADDAVIGAPFYLMDEVPGTVLRTRDQTGALSEDERRGLSHTLVDTLAELHSVDPAAVGLDGLGRPDGYLRRQVDRWTRQYRQVKTRDLAHVEQIIGALNDSMPPSPATSIVHGDYRIDNVIVDPADPGRILAVLDWEMATLGDPLADLGTFLMFWDEPGTPFNPVTGGLAAFPGFCDSAEVIARYAARRDVTVEHIGWYQAFAQFRLAVILEQIYVRHRSGETRGEGFDTVGDAVPLLLEAAYTALSGR